MVVMAMVATPMATSHKVVAITIAGATIGTTVTAVGTSEDPAAAAAAAAVTVAAAECTDDFPRGYCDNLQLATPCAQIVFN